MFHAMQNDSLATLLARLEGILGQLPQHMVRKGRFSHRFYTRQGVIYERSQRTVSPHVQRGPPVVLLGFRGSLSTAFVLGRHVPAVQGCCLNCCTYGPSADSPCLVSTNSNVQCRVDTSSSCPSTPRCLTVWQVLIRGL